MIKDKNLEGLIGNTPMVMIKYEYLGKEKYLYAKLEYYNFTGSIKDRMVNYILQEAIKKGELTENQPIIEATSGNTGISLAAIGAYYKHPVHIFMPDWVSLERRKIMEMYGAKVYLVSREEGGFLEAIKRADELANKIKGYRSKQFDNLNNVKAHYESTAKEIVNTLKDIGGFVSGIGTGGTLMGVGKYLKEHFPKTKIYGMEPDTMPILSKGENKGSHLIEGIGDDFIPSIVEKELLDEVIAVNDLDSIQMARKIARELGLGVGISSGANFLAGVIAGENTPNMVTVFPDDNKKYISTKLSEEMNNNEKYMSNKIKLIGMEKI